MADSLSRRDMLKATLAAAAGFTVGPDLGMGRLSTLYAAGTAAAAMPTRRLGKTGFEVPLFSLGGQATLEQPGRLEDSVRIIHRALDLGVRYIDTSHIYGNGVSEQYIGEVLKDRRDEVFLATKSRDYSYDGTLRVVEQSLQRLQTDHLDLYQHHNVSSDEGLRQVLGPNGAFKAFVELQEQGVIKHRGITGHSSRILHDAIRQEPFDCVLITLNPANMVMLEGEHLAAFMAETVRQDIGVIGMKVVGKGALLNRPVSMQQAMHYTLSFPVSTVIIGITRVEQLDENVRIARAFEPMSDEAMAALETVARG
jgi:uncharacterized protein